MTTTITCARIGCEQPTSYERPLCYAHWREFDRYEITECDKCHRFDEMVGEVYAQGLADGDYCWDCARGEDVPVHVHRPVEHQRYYLYILKLDGGTYYIGQTKDLELRLQKHRDGLTRSTVGRHPRLVYFEERIGDREILVEDERDLTLVNKRNPRAIRRIVTGWQRLIRQVHIED